MNKELQRAQDMLGAMQQQRDQALNSVVMVQVELMDRDRRIVALEREIETLKPKVDEVNIEDDPST